MRRPLDLILHDLEAIETWLDELLPRLPAPEQEEAGRMHSTLTSAIDDLGGRAAN